MAIIHQTAQTPLLEWNSGLLDCFEDVHTCCYGFWCCPCLACTVSGRFGECTCLPLCELFTPTVMAACGIPLFAPVAVISMRASMRNRYGIKGSILKDIASGCFCSWCSWCQMHRELKERKQLPIIMNIQPQTIIHSHPAPMVINPAVPPPVHIVSQQGVHSQPGVIVTSN